MSAPLFLVWHGAPGAEVEVAEPNHPLAEGMFLVRSERTLSKLYHAIKHQLPEDTALCVAPLADAPKFKGLAEGALKWLRSGA
ncbi:hypothetical protein [Histidinibacterium aquaticum]|uniref:Uncharacterized protein n=1 Tax=Histidinibacterium aquaticum TaxID=2613962 RepID=A0A5J5GNT5_9RHOB|nr:hypothetical protein [Histidinibacterium aquaticum]KAA9009194.1 hypothetical protein F3S47_08040 [Histidinibacterium aquaticum]